MGAGQGKKGKPEVAKDEEVPAVEASKSKGRGKASRAVAKPESPAVDEAEVGEQPGSAGSKELPVAQGTTLTR